MRIDSLILQQEEYGCRLRGGGGDIYAPIFEVGDGLYCHPMHPHISRFNVIVYRLKYEILTKIMKEIGLEC